MKLYSIILFLIIVSCAKEYEYKNDYSVNQEKLNYKLDSVKKSVIDSIKKSDSLKIQIGTARFNKKKIKIFDNFTWEYKNKLTSSKKTKTLNFYSENQFISSGTCGALTKKGTSCRRKVKGGGRCWQHN